MCFHSTASTNFLQVLSTMNFSLNILYSPLTLCLKKTSVLNYISYNTPIHPIIFYLSQRILVSTLTLCMLFTLFAPAANVNAASKRTKALTAYQKKLKKLDSKIYKFALVYLDKDSIPELVITSKESTHAIYGEIYTYNNGKLKNLKYAGSDFGQFIYSPKKSVACNSSWINGYGAVSTFYRFSKTGKSTKLKRFDAIVNPKTSYKINNKKVSKKKYYAEYKKMEKKYPLKQISLKNAFNLTTKNIKNITKNYKSFIVTGAKY